MSSFAHAKRVNKFILPLGTYIFIFNILSETFLMFLIYGKLGHGFMHGYIPLVNLMGL